MKREIEDRKKWILVPGKNSEDLLFYQYRLSVEDCTPRYLGMRLKNTGTGLLDARLYIGNIKWEDAIRLNLLSGYRTANIRQFMDFRLLLEQGVREGKEVFDGNGSKIDQNRVLGIYSDLQAQQEPYRGEFLDAYFVSGREGRLCINYSSRLEEGVVLGKSELLDECLMESGFVDISSLNRQGLPTEKAISSNVIYHYPRNDSITGFGAGSVRVSLVCGGNPRDTNAGLGIRPVIVRER
ncbi:hypothetical protein HYU23_02645 [Candidatus Woesearchaeota archaeon]|nr:hypothetical protein [Candidatus Woesearchaeota archaeon]